MKHFGRLKKLSKLVLRREEVLRVCAIFAVSGLSSYSYVEIIPGAKLNARKNFFWIQPEPWCQAEMAPYHGVW
jgi:hypothetical protein